MSIPNADLQTQYDALTASSETITHVQNIGNVQQFYASASDTETMCLQMYQYALNYVTYHVFRKESVRSVRYMEEIV